MADRSVSSVGLKRPQLGEVSLSERLGADIASLVQFIAPGFTAMAVHQAYDSTAKRNVTGFTLSSPTAATYFDRWSKADNALALRRLGQLLDLYANTKGIWRDFEVSINAGGISVTRPPVLAEDD